MTPAERRLLPMPLRAAAFGLVWGLLWAGGYSPADYPVRLAVRAFGHPVSARNVRGSYFGGIYNVEYKTEAGVTISEKENAFAKKVRGGNQFLALDLAGVWTVHRFARGFPFGTFDLYVTAALALLLIRLQFPEFLGAGPTRPRAGAFRIPFWVLRAADIAVAACALLGTEMYSAAQAWITCAVWFALRLARLRGYVEFLRLLPPTSEPPRLALPGSENAPVRPTRVLRNPEGKGSSFLAYTTPDGWSRIPAGATAVGLLILAVVQMRNRLISVPEPGYRVLGLALPHWQAIGWSLLACAAVVAVREFLAAWRRSDDG